MKVKFLSTAITVCIALLVLAGLFGRFGWPFEVIASLMPQIALAGGATALLLALTRRYRKAMIAGASAIIALIACGAQFLPGPPPPEDPDLRLVWANLYTKPEAVHRVIALAKSEGADLVILGETHEPTLAEIASYSHRVIMPMNLRADGAVLSEVPVKDLGPMPLPNVLGPLVSVETGAGQVHVAAVHVFTPVSPARTRGRNADIGAALAINGGLERAVLVGDFNTVPWSSAFRDTERRYGMRRIAYGPWSSWLFDPDSRFWPEWLKQLPFFGLPIDHVFVTGDLTAHVSVGPDIGSDHRPLIVDVSVRHDD